MRTPCLEVVIDGIAYTIGQEPEAHERGKPYLLGFSGRRFDIELATGERVTTRNLIYRGPCDSDDDARFIGGAGVVAVPGGFICWQHSREEPWQW